MVLTTDHHAREPAWKRQGAQTDRTRARRGTTRAHRPLQPRRADFCRRGRRATFGSFVCGANGASTQPRKGGVIGVTFGVIFDIYADISDSLVGILMRAKKRKRLAFEADMLFQGVHDSVVIRIIE